MMLQRLGYENVNGEFTGVSNFTWVGMSFSGPLAHRLLSIKAGAVERAPLWPRVQPSNATLGRSLFYLGRLSCVCLCWCLWWGNIHDWWFAVSYFLSKPGCWSGKVIILFILHTHLNAQHILVFLNSNKLCKLNFSVHRDLYPQRSYEKINRPQEAAAKWEKVACSPLSLCMNVFSFFKIKPERGCCLCLFWKTVLLLVCAHGVSWLDVNPTPQKHLACVAN